MNETIIEYDNKKRIRGIFFGILLIVVCLAFLYFMVFITRRISLPFAVALVVVPCMSIYYIFVCIKQINSDDKVGLILNEQGCFFKQSKAGNIKWTDIASLYVKRIDGTKYVLLRLINPDKYVNKEGITEPLKNFIIKHGVGVTSGELAISFDDMNALIKKYFEFYKQQN